MKTIIHAAVGLFLATVASASPITSFYYTSGPNSWVGGGATETMTPANGYLFSIQGNDQTVEFSVHNASDSDWWYLDFSAASGQLLTPGYSASATRFPFNGSGAGLSFFGDGRGDNTLTGNFTVLGATYAANGSVLSFAASFTQYDEGHTDWWNTGLIEYNYTPSSAPETANSLLLLAIGGIGCVMFRNRFASQRQ